MNVEAIASVSESTGEVVNEPAGVATRDRVRPPKDDSSSIATDFSHPVYKRLSQINGAINRLRRDELVKKLAELHLSSSGAKEVLRKRLKSHYKTQKLAQNQMKDQADNRYDYILVIDFEATCKQENPSTYKHEIIEFPVVVVDCNSKSIVDQFHSYVRPRLNPTLTKFCTDLTGITQEMVDSADPFPVVLDRMWNWVTSNKYHKHMAVLTDGPWDMSRFMFLSCQLNGIKVPKWSRRWINIRKAFSNYYDCKRMCLREMLEAAALSFDGQPHCGLDDSKNIARLTTRLLEDGWSPFINERMYCRKIEANNHRVSTLNSHDGWQYATGNGGGGSIQTLSREQAKVLESEDSDEGEISQDLGND